MHKISLPKFSDKIFKAYDIRGKYPEEINEDAAYKIARSFASYLKISNRDKRLLIIVCSDTRLSSPALKNAFIKGLVDEKANVLDAGITTTPMHYFAVNAAKADGGGMITASHLPKEFNGIKLSKTEAVPISEGFGMEEIKNTALRGIFLDSGRGSMDEKNFLGDYIDFFSKKFFRLARYSVKIKTDFKNSVVGLILPEILKKKFSKFELSKNSGVVGVSFDPDGDRIFFFDEEDNEISGDIITALLIKRFEEENKFRIVYDIRSSRVVKEEVEKYGGNAIESRIGHSFIKRTMREHDAIFGGELSGHYYFRDFFYADSAIFTMFSVIDLLCKEKKSLGELVKPLLRYSVTPELNFGIKNKDILIDKAASAFSNGKISYLDGIKIDYPDWWFILRPSNTEDLIRLRVEATTPELLEEKKKLILDTLNLK